MVSCADGQGRPLLRMPARTRSLVSRAGRSRAARMHPKKPVNPVVDPSWEGCVVRPGQQRRLRPPRSIERGLVCRLRPIPVPAAVACNFPTNRGGRPAPGGPLCVGRTRLRQALGTPLPAPRPSDDQPPDAAVGAHPAVLAQIALHVMQRRLLVTRDGSDRLTSPQRRPHLILLSLRQPVRSHANTIPGPSTNPRGALTG